MSIIIENLSYTYSPKTPYEKVALKDVTFTVESGEFFGIVGHTGSGKSTLVSHFNGLTKLMQGKLIVADMDLSQKYDYKKLRSKVGMVFQYPEYQLFDETVERDVGFGPKNIGLSEAEIKERVKDAINTVGLNYESIKDRSPFELSGGQMRRVALAGVLAMRPEILVLDEPTAGLDPKGKQEILSIIGQVHDSGKTIIMISHNMEEIAANCARVAVMDNGSLAGIFTPCELFSSDELTKKLSLELPSYAKVASALRNKGYDVPADNQDNVVSSILKLWEKKQDA